MSQLKIAEVVLVHLYLVNNQYQQDLRDINTFTINKSFEKLIEILPSLFILSSIFSSEFSYTEIRFTEQHDKQPELWYNKFYFSYKILKTEKSQKQTAWKRI